MMRGLISAALRFRVLVVALAAMLVVLGIQTAGDVPFDVFPEFAPVLVEIQTEAAGLSTEEVESLVTVPIENAVNGVAFLETLRSKSVLGLSSVVLIFERGTDLMVARQLVQERLGSLGTRLPSVANAPVMLSPLSATSRILKIGVSSDSMSRIDLTTLARWTIRPRLTAIPGVANVAIWGEEVRQLQALVRPEQLRANGVTLDQVTAAARAGLTVSAGGFVDTPNQRLPVTQRQAIRTADEYASLAVAFRNGSPLTLGDVAEVKEGAAPMIGDAVINDGPGLLLIVEKQPWGNTFEITKRVEAALAAMQPGLPGVEVDTTIFRPATFIEMSLANLQKALFLGCLFVVLILVCFLYEWRTAMISLVAIPLSLLGALLVLYWRGGTLNTMVLAGLIIALGEVVDDAIIDVENIVRRLRLNRSLSEPRSSFKVVLDASMEVRSAVIYGSLIVVFMLTPVFFLGGLTGAFFRPLAFSYILAISASLVVALTVTPALSLMLLRSNAGRQEDAPIVAILKSRYRKLLERLVGAWRGALIGMVALFALTAAVVPFLGEELLPDFKEYDFLMHWVEKPGTSLEAMQRITLRASKELRSIPGVRNFGAHIGRAEVADEVVGPNFTELWISLDPEVDYDSTVAKVQEVVDGYPGLYRDLLTYLKERIKEVLTGSSASIVVRIYGPDLEGLRNQAKEVAEAIGAVAGTSDLHVEQQVLVPQIVVRLRPGAIQRFGTVPGDVRRQIATILAGAKVGEIYEDQATFDVVVWGAEDVRDSVESLRELRIDTPNGAQPSLNELAEVFIGSAPNVIQREGASRRIDVMSNVRGRDLGSVAREIETVVANLPMRTGFHAEVQGEFAERRRATSRLYQLFGLALLLMFLVLNTEFGSLRLTLLVFLSLPFALVGGVTAVVLGGGVLSLGSIIGFVTVFGIAARNGIMLISHYRHLEEEEGVAPGRALVMRGSEERLAPILMTGLTTMLALLPIIITGNLPGQEIEHPMAIAIVGGLVTSTILNLFLLPALYQRFGSKAQPNP